MEDLISTAEAAEILGVSKRAIAYWRTRKLFGCVFFAADEKRGGTWYYYRERVEQLKAVYQKGVLQDMYKLEFLNSEAEEDDSELFQNSVTRVCTEEIPRSSHKGFLTMDEVARDLGVDKMTIWRWAKENHLRWDLYDHHEKFLFKRETVEKFKARQQKRQQNIVSIEEKKQQLTNLPEEILAQPRFQNKQIRFGRAGESGAQSPLRCLLTVSRHTGAPANLGRNNLLRAPHSAEENFRIKNMKTFSEIGSKGVHF